jgi:hypothetical protein
MSAPYIPDASGSSERTTIRRASTPSTTPERFATTAAPESLATTDSIPVPTNGGSVRRSGTACRCMLDPMSARLASSCSRNGTREAATETSWFGETSIRVTSAERTIANSPPWRAMTTSWTNLPFASVAALACAMTCRSSSIAERKTISFVTAESLTTRYGVSMNPNSLIRAKVDSEAISPMFGPSGVSIGQMRP